jgi:transcriptional regulator with XRE-family HTH domain
MSISSQLKKAIKASGMGYRELSRETGVAQPIISRFMAGERSLTLESVDALAKTLGLELADRQDRPRRPSSG